MGRGRDVHRRVERDEYVTPEEVSMKVDDTGGLDSEAEIGIVLLPHQGIAHDPAHALLEWRDLGVVPTQSLREQAHHVALLECAYQLLEDFRVVDFFALVVLWAFDREGAGRLDQPAGKSSATELGILGRQSEERPPRFGDGRDEEEGVCQRVGVVRGEDARDPIFGDVLLALDHHVRIEDAEDCKARIACQWETAECRDATGGDGLPNRNNQRMIMYASGAGEPAIPLFVRLVSLGLAGGVRVPSVCFVGVISADNEEEAARLAIRPGTQRLTRAYARVSVRTDPKRFGLSAGRDVGGEAKD